MLSIFSSACWPLYIFFKEMSFLVICCFKSRVFVLFCWVLWFFFFVVKGSHCQRVWDTLNVLSPSWRLEVYLYHFKGSQNEYYKKLLTLCNTVFSIDNYCGTILHWTLIPILSQWVASECNLWKALLRV